MYLKVYFDSLPNVTFAHRAATYSMSRFNNIEDVLELTLVDEGDWTITIGNHINTVMHPGDFFVVPPEAPYSYKAAYNGMPYTLRAIGIIRNFRYEILSEKAVLNHALMNDYLDISLLKNNYAILPLHFPGDRGLKVSDRFNSIIKEFNSPHASLDLMLSGQFLCLTADITKRCLEFFKGKYQKSNPPSNHLYVQKIISYLNGNYNKQLDFEHLAGYMNLNRDYVCALFKKVTNQSITRYLIGIRIKKAKELLLNTNFNMNSICLEVGIENEQYFCKLFKKYEGISPNQYRSLYWRGL